MAKRVNGRVMITNYDPAVLTNEDLFRLHEEADDAPFNDVLIDIRPGFVGGEMPLHGRLRLRSFHEILTFIGRGMDEEPEYDVDAGPAHRRSSGRTPFARWRSSRAPAAAGHELYVGMNGHYYACAVRTGISGTEGLQPALPAVPDERLHRRPDRPGDHDREVNGADSAG